MEQLEKKTAQLEVESELLRKKIKLLEMENDKIRSSSSDYGSKSDEFYYNDEKKAMTTTNCTAGNQYNLVKFRSPFLDESKKKTPINSSLYPIFLANSPRCPQTNNDNNNLLRHPQPMAQFGSMTYQQHHLHHRHAFHQTLLLLQTFLICFFQMQQTRTTSKQQPQGYLPTHGCNGHNAATIANSDTLIQNFLVACMSNGLASNSHMPALRKILSGESHPPLLQRMVQTVKIYQQMLIQMILESDEMKTMKTFSKDSSTHHLWRMPWNKRNNI